MNDRAALGQLLDRGPMTRTQLGRTTGLSGPTTSQVVERLTRRGLVREAGHAAGSRGPNAVVYQACTDQARGVAVHIRGARAEAQVVDAAGTAYPIAAVRLTAKPRTALTDLTTTIAAACAAAGLEPAAIGTVCVGVPGAVSRDTDHLRFADDLPGWPRHFVRAQLESGLAMTVLIENDAVLAGVAEARTTGDDADFALFWQGEGLRVAPVAAGQVHRGTAGGAGEIGYLAAPHTVTALDPQVTDLQSLAGSVGVTRLVRSHYPATRTYAAALARLADPQSRPALLADLAPRIVETLIPVIAVLDPARIVWSGPTGAACGPEGAALVAAYLRRTTRWRTPIVATAVPTHPVLTGAAWTVTHHLAEALLGRIT